jgi:hypothetical protein
MEVLRLLLFSFLTRIVSITAAAFFSSLFLALINGGRRHHDASSICWVFSLFFQSSEYDTPGHF